MTKSGSDGSSSTAEVHWKPCCVPLPGIQTLLMVQILNSSGDGQWTEEIRHESSLTMVSADNICIESREQVVERSSEKRNWSHLEAPRLRRFVQRRDSGHAGLLNTDLPGWRTDPQRRFIDVERWCDSGGYWLMEAEGDQSGLTASNLRVNRGQSETPPGEAQPAWMSGIQTKNKLRDHLIPAAHQSEPSSWCPEPERLRSAHVPA